MNKGASSKMSSPAEFGRFSRPKRHSVISVFHTHGIMYAYHIKLDVEKLGLDLILTISAFWKSREISKCNFRGFAKFHPGNIRELRGQMFWNRSTGAPRSYFLRQRAIFSDISHSTGPQLEPG